LTRILLRQMPDADQFEHLRDTLGDGGGPETTPAQGIGDVLEDRQVGPQRVALEDDADRALLGRSENAACGGEYRPAADLDLTAVGLFEPCDAAQQGGLAAAARAEQHHELAGTHLERDVVDRCDRGAVPALEALSEI